MSDMMVEYYPHVVAYVPTSAFAPSLSAKLHGHYSPDTVKKHCLMMESAPLAARAATIVKMAYKQPLLLYCVMSSMCLRARRRNSKFRRTHIDPAILRQRALRKQQLAKAYRDSRRGLALINRIKKKAQSMPLAIKDVERSTAVGGEDSGVGMVSLNSCNFPMNKKICTIIPQPRPIELEETEPESEMAVQSMMGDEVANMMTEQHENLDIE